MLGHMLNPTMAWHRATRCLGLLQEHYLEGSASQGKGACTFYFQTITFLDLAYFLMNSVCVRIIFPRHTPPPLGPPLPRSFHMFPPNARG